MTGTRAVIYAPPGARLPFIGVVFGRDGEVLIARSAGSNAEAKALLTTIMTHFVENANGEALGVKLEGTQARKRK
jgi:hypothetical protein